jgi:hypothetical protein
MARLARGEDLTGPLRTVKPRRTPRWRHEPKTRHLYDTDGFPVGAVFSYFHRNLLRIQVLGSGSALFENRQIRVKKNTYPSRKVRKRAFLMGWFSVVGKLCERVAARGVHYSFGAGLTWTVQPGAKAARG